MLWQRSIYANKINHMSIKQNFTFKSLENSCSYMSWLVMEPMIRLSMGIKGKIYNCNYWLFNLRSQPFYTI